MLEREKSKHIGAIVLKHSVDLDKVEVMWVHTTPSFCIAFRSPNKVVFKISRKDHDKAMAVNSTYL